MKGLERARAPMETGLVLWSAGCRRLSVDGVLRRRIACPADAILGRRPSVRPISAVRRGYTLRWVYPARPAITTALTALAVRRRKGGDGRRKRPYRL